MLSSLSFPLYGGCLREYGSMEGLRDFCAGLGLDGIEAIRGSLNGDVPLPPPELTVGWHLIFWADWVDFWRGDEAALTRKFGSAEAAEEFYGGWGRKYMIKQYRRDLEAAEKCGARYAVLHVSDVSVEECYTYRWKHTDEEVIAAAAELLDELKNISVRIPVFVENQWWPGFRFTEPKLTAALLEAAGKNAGIMLDTGHLMSTCTALGTEADAEEYIVNMLEKHGRLAERVRGVHLNRSLSGEYVKSHTGALPEGFPRGGTEQFAASYGHILKIDRHEPWTTPSVRRVVERISPDFLTHELAGASRRERETAVRTQLAALGKI